MSQQWRSNAQLSGQIIKHVRHADERTSAKQKWQYMTPGYYIPKTNMPFQSTLVVGYYISKLVPVLNPNATYSKLECNQLLTHLEQLRNLERRPSHRFGSQQPVELVEIIMALIVV